MDFIDWNFFNEIVASNDVTFEVSVLRLALSFVAGAAVGIDRQKRMQPAGLRTHTLICMGATLVMLISIYLPQTFVDFKNGDPARIAAQVVSGIGFLGAGAIIKFGVNIKGLTTAASVWLISTVGLAIGCGLYKTSFVCILFILFILKGLDWLEKRYFSHILFKTLIVEIEGKEYNSEHLKGILREFKIKILNSDISYSVDKDVKVYNFAIEVPENINLDDLNLKISSQKSLISYKLFSL